MNLLRFSFKAKNKNGSWVFAYFDESGRQLEWRFSSTYGYGNPSQIDTETLCQSTGILDSDGELIYEHDYIDVFDSKSEKLEEQAEILWDGCEWNKKSRFICSFRGLLGLYKAGEVNIYITGNRFD
jgi:hypothetical protein